MKTVKYLMLVLIVQYNAVMAQQQVSMDEVRNAALQTLNSRQAKGDANDEARVQKINTLKNKAENTLMYEAVFDNGQAVLLSGSKACLPMLGYFDLPDGKSIFDDDMPCCLKFLLQEYKEQIDLCFQNDTIQLYYKNEWQELQQETSASKQQGANLRAQITNPTTIVVAPLLTSRWGQGELSCNDYNYYVPSGCGSCNKLAGCVAVAMAQTMYYWKYPVYTVNLTNIEMTFDWCNMVDALNAGSPNYINERNAVARLIKYCGDEVGMSYGCSASSASTSDTRNALVNKFNYSGDASYQKKSSYSNSNWISKIKSNLNQGRPVLYRGESTGGHAFVCDGYTSDDFFHFNWGWYGSYGNWWFTLNDLNPGSYNFTSSQAAVFNIYPQNTQDYCDFELSLQDHYLALVTSIAYKFALLGVPFQAIPSQYFETIHQANPKYATRLTSAYPGTIKIGNITTSTPPSWYTVEPGETKEYVAHESIILKPGFHAKAGSNFTARIEPCNNCISATVKVKSLSSSGVEVEEELYIAVGDNEEELFLSEKEIAIAKLQVYPNPTTGLLTIDAENDNNSIQMIELYSTQGTKLFSFGGNSGFFQEIDISHLPSQVYILKIQANGQTFTKRLILQK